MISIKYLTATWQSVACIKSSLYWTPFMTFCSFHCVLTGKPNVFLSDTYCERHFCVSCLCGRIRSLEIGFYDNKNGLYLQPHCSQQRLERKVMNVCDYKDHRPKSTSSSVRPQQTTQTSQQKHRHGFLREHLSSYFHPHRLRGWRRRQPCLLRRLSERRSYWDAREWRGRWRRQPSLLHHRLSSARDLFALYCKNIQYFTLLYTQTNSFIRSLI